MRLERLRAQMWEWRITSFFFFEQLGFWDIALKNAGWKCNDVHKFLNAKKKKKKEPLQWDSIKLDQPMDPSHGQHLKC